MSNITNVLVKLVDEAGVTLTLKGKPIIPEKAFAPIGLLPAMARRADQVASLCLGYGIGISFDEADGSILGVKVIFDDVTPHTLRVLCIYDVMIDIINFSEDKEKIALDELLYD